MKKIKLSSYFLFISIFTFVTIFLLIVQSGYNNLMKPVNQVKTNESLKPIDPNLDISVLDTIAKRQFYSADLATPVATPSSLTP